MIEEGFVLDGITEGFSCLGYDGVWGGGGVVCVVVSFLEGLGDVMGGGCWGGGIGREGGGEERGG